ncbi:MAG: S41 family peptidase [Alphaproteobacteria bacterium]|nr:S41 family peptidase [Alphaproteobacteria bacterium]
MLSRSLLLSTAILSLFSFSDSVLAEDSKVDPASEKSAATKNLTQEQLNAETYKQLSLFGSVFETVREKYVDTISDEKLIEYAIKGMLTNLDPHSDYMTAKDFDDMKVQTKGEFGGLGIEVTMQDGLVKVVSPIDDTPAFKAGIQPGDLISHLDKKPIIGMTLAEAVEKMRGKVGSSVELTVRREGINEPLFIKIKRDTIKIKSVRYHVEGGDVGYIRITTFNQNTYNGLKDAFENIKKESNNKLVGYVLDLRNNPGGLLDQAISVSDAFLDKGEIVSTRGRNDEAINRDNALPGDLADGLPVVVLINGGSASASEIVSGALQDHHRAVVMGTKSFGKGSVQTVIPTPGQGAMRLTTARYFTPSGRSIQSKGIEPDILVEPAKIEKLDEIRIGEEDLKGAISNPDTPKTTPPIDSADSIDPVDPAPEGNQPPKDKASLEKEQAKQDYQLARALDLLHGLSLIKAGKQ